MEYLKIFKLIFVSSGFVLFLISIYSFVYKIPENRCEMTFMFQWPEYVEIELSKEIREKFPRYGLFVYGEGNYADRLRRGDFGGIPVLFIPGNAGSHRQVRSLGSVSMTKTERSPAADIPEFNYFSIDFDEELTGLYGGYLDTQTEFTAKCIERILELYQNRARDPPKSMIVVGHSMGGVIARGLFAYKNFSSSLIRLVITLASPHAAPPATFDRVLGRYYDRLNEYWSQNTHASLENVTVLSIGGGDRDVMVRSDLTRFDRSLRSMVVKMEASGFGGSTDESTDDVRPSGLSLYETLSTRVPWVWASTDHLCIVWCKQLVMATIRLLFDLTDGEKEFIAEKTIHRERIEYHFFARNDWTRSEKAKKERHDLFLEERDAHDAIWSGLAKVIRHYAHFFPSICVCYVCLFLTFDSLISETSRNGSIIKAMGFIGVSSILAMRITNEGELLSAVSAVFMAYGLFEALGLVARILLVLCSKCCRPASRPSESKTNDGWSAIATVFIIRAIATGVLSIWSISLIVAYTSIIYTIYTEVRTTNRVPSMQSNLIVRSCLILIAIFGPWTVVLVQNIAHGGTVLPHDPSLVPVLVWICSSAIAKLYKFDEQSSRLSVWTLVNLLVGVTSVVYARELYVCTYCLSLLLGAYSCRRRVQLHSTTTTIGTVKLD